MEGGQTISYFGRANINKNTSILRAARFSNKKVVRMLLDRGATPSVRNLVGMTPLHLACLFNNIDIAKVITIHLLLMTKTLFYCDSLTRFKTLL